MKSLLVVLVLFLSFSGFARGVDEEAYWVSILDKQYVTVEVGGSFDSLREGDELRAEVIRKLKENPSFAQLVRRSLRNDPRIWVRSFSAIMLIQAFKKEGTLDDYIVILSDPAWQVHGFGRGGALSYRIEGVAEVLGASLLNTNSAVRSSAISGIGSLLGWKGLPYYSALLNDSNVDVAVASARAFRLCKKEDAIPHLLRYLKQYGQEKGKDDVTRCVVESLFILFGESVPQKIETQNAVDVWIQRLELVTSTRPEFDSNVGNDTSR